MITREMTTLSGILAGVVVQADDDVLALIRFDMDGGMWCRTTLEIAKQMAPSITERVEVSGLAQRALFENRLMRFEITEFAMVVERLGTVGEAIEALRQLVPDDFDPEAHLKACARGLEWMLPNTAITCPACGDDQVEVENRPGQPIDDDDDARCACGWRGVTHVTEEGVEVITLGAG